MSMWDKIRDFAKQSPFLFEKKRKERIEEPDFDFMDLFRRSAAGGGKLSVFDRIKRGWAYGDWIKQRIADKFKNIFEKGYSRNPKDRLSAGPYFSDDDKAQVDAQNAARRDGAERDGHALAVIDGWKRGGHDGRGGPDLGGPAGLSDQRPDFRVVGVRIDENLIEATPDRKRLRGPEAGENARDVRRSEKTPAPMRAIAGPLAGRAPAVTDQSSSKPPSPGDEGAVAREDRARELSRRGQDAARRLADKREAQEGEASPRSMQAGSTSPVAQGSGRAR